MDESTIEGCDFIASELLQELKAENQRKSLQINNLHKIIWRTVIVAVIAVLLVVGGMLVYLYQYDFVDTSYEERTYTADGFYAIIDSDGNIISRDIPEDVLQEVLNGKSIPENSEGNG